MNIHESAYDFAEYARINLSTIYKIINGGSMRKDIAKRVVRVTKKKVTLEELGYGLKKDETLEKITNI